jgi:hypothetical protein
MPVLRLGLCAVVSTTSYGKNTRATALKAVLSTDVVMIERSTMRDRFHWARLLAFVTGESGTVAPQ